MGLSDFIKTNKIKGAIFDMDGTLADSILYEAGGRGVRV